MDKSHWGDVHSLDGLTVEEVFYILEDNGQDPEVFITPPDPAALTDEDSADEDDGGIPDNLTERQLLAEAEIKIPSPKTDNQFDAGTYKIDRKRKWVPGDLVFIPTTKFDCVTTKYNNMSCVELFELFIDGEIIEQLTNETSKYADFLNLPNPNVSGDEIKAFIAILLLSGYNILPGRTCNWDGDDMKNKLVTNAMRKDRFLQIMEFIHVSDNNIIDPLDKYHKVRPMIEKIKSKCLEHFTPHEYLNYDEIMISYYGRHINCKRNIKRKPVRFGYKACCLNTDFGYLVSFDLYEGKSASLFQAYETTLGRAAAPIVRLLDQLPPEKKNYPYNIFFNNQFTGMNLLAHLRERGYHGTGTIREIRIPKDCPIPSNNAMKIVERGTCKSFLEKKDGIILAKWNDQSVVSIASTAYGLAFVKVKKHSYKIKKNIHVIQPQAIAKYNKHVGGTCKMNENVNDLRISIRGRKWWWAIFTWLLDVSMNNGWVLHKKFKGKISKLQFRRNVVLDYLTRYRKPLEYPGEVPRKASKSKG